MIHFVSIGLAGKDWMRSFMRRYNLPVRKTEHTSAARAKSFNKQAVIEFFNLLDDILKKHKFHPADIYNVDESGDSMCSKMFI